MLKRKLDALAAQTLPVDVFELVLCLNGCGQDVRRLVEASDFGFGVTLLEFTQPRPVSSARNACARMAKGATLYFSDDDCLPAAETLELHLNAQRKRPCAAIGSIQFEERDHIDTWAPARVGYWNLNGANTSVPRRQFEEVGGFDETLTDYGGEDVLLGYRLAKSGLPQSALPYATTRHLGPQPRRSRDTVKAVSAGRNAVKIARLHPELAWRLGVHPLSLLAKRIALGRTWRRLWRRLDAAAYDYERAYLEGALEEQQNA